MVKSSWEGIKSVRGEGAREAQCGLMIADSLSRFCVLCPLFRRPRCGGLSTGCSHGHWLGIACHYSVLLGKLVTPPWGFTSTVDPPLSHYQAVSLK